MVEQQILSTIMFDIDNYHEALDAGVTPEWFEGEDRLLFQAIMEQADKKPWGKRDNIMVFKDVFEKFPFALDYCQNTPEWAHKVEDFDAALDVLRDNYARRSLTENLNSAGIRLTRGDDPMIIADELSVVAQVVSSSGREESRTIREVAAEAYKIDEKIASGEPFGLPFPWKPFQDRTYGIPRKAVTPMAGRDGKGKSRLMTYLAHWWVSHDIPILYFPFEDCSERFATNMAATHGQYDAFGVKNPLRKPSYMDTHARSLDEISNYPLYVCDHSNTVSRLVSTIARHKRKYDIQGVVVDGFKDVIPEDGESQTVRENFIMAALVRAAKEYDVSIIPIMHLTKLEDDQWISRRNIRGTGTISQSARMVLVCQDSGFPQGLTDKYGVLEDCIVLECQKASYGDTGCIALKPELERGIFTEIER